MLKLSQHAFHRLILRLGLDPLKEYELIRHMIDTSVEINLELASSLVNILYHNKRNRYYKANYPTKGDCIFVVRETTVITILTQDLNTILPRKGLPISTYKGGKVCLVYKTLAS